MFKIIDKEIHATRGDVGCINVTAKSKIINEYGIEERIPYKFKAGDIIRLTIVKKSDYSQIMLRKDVDVPEETEKVTILLDSNDTTIGEVISKPTTYWYEVELNPDTKPQTIIGHDKETGAKLFVLYPEGRNVNE